eukprot:GHVU01123801.1.p5 GENE.GHVU01123801.1~~GHVU01123801.1.p5  ORF type:complete len:106 (+),score=7.17 GHVU01123801.1:1831-2148(+)
MSDRSCPQLRCHEKNKYSSGDPCNWLEIKTVPRHVFHLKCVNMRQSRCDYSCYLQKRFLFLSAATLAQQVMRQQEVINGVYEIAVALQGYRASLRMIDNKSLRQH